MRRLQLGSSMGSSVDASNPPSQRQTGQNQPAQSQTAQGQSANTAANKTTSTDNNAAAPRKECESATSAALIYFKCYRFANTLKLHYDDTIEVERTTKLELDLPTLACPAK